MVGISVLFLFLEQMLSLTFCKKLAKKLGGRKGCLIGGGGCGGHIRCCGNGRLWFRSYSGSLLKSAKVSKTLLPH
ncbi:MULTISPECIES: hypothetical protein, partial [unclassified Pseudomonas]|uniref:hypothetical protein n=2 Tax=Pseudomonas TaxID=286 RepID=UPI001C454F3F